MTAKRRDVGREVRPVPAGDVPLLGAQIADEHRGGILVGGRTVDEAAIAQAVETRVRGLIVGSVSSALLPALEAAYATFAPERTFEAVLVDERETDPFDALGDWLSSGPAGAMARTRRGATKRARVSTWPA